MKVELHLHTRRYSGCAAHTAEEMLAALAAFGYDAAYLTEHDAVWPRDDIARLQDRFPQIRVFPGLEKSSREAPQHVVILGADDASYLDEQDDRRLLERARAEGHLVILAHPFRWSGGDRLLRDGQGPSSPTHRAWGPLLPDALELRTNNHDEQQAQASAEAAARLGLKLVNCGDSHAIDFLDKFWIETDRPIVEADDIRSIVLEGAYRNSAGPARAMGRKQKAREP